jgi:hypothetical protein
VALTPWQTHKKYGGRATSETWVEAFKGQMGMGKLRTARFLANGALFHSAVQAYNTQQWMAVMNGSHSLRQWKPETIRTYLIRVTGKLLTGNRKLAKTPDNHLYPNVWDVRIMRCINSYIARHAPVYTHLIRTKIQRQLLKSFHVHS